MMCKTCKHIFLVTCFKAAFASRYAAKIYTEKKMMHLIMEKNTYTLQSIYVYLQICSRWEFSNRRLCVSREIQKITESKHKILFCYGHTDFCLVIGS